ncbi:MAG: hypothetical protein HQ572_05230 [Candidatus Omnitrophica bacterium]|nr:hypothetical protein [Candidatus Omnitrophota bacterium]
MKILKFILLLVLIILIAGSGMVYLNRSRIFDYSINKLIENLLPDYMEVGKIELDLEGKNLDIRDFKIRNPKGCRHPYLLEVPKVKAFFSQRNPQEIKDGLEVGDAQLFNPVLYLERLKDSSLNIQHMEEVFKQKKKVQVSSLKSKFFGLFSYLSSPVKRLEDLIEIKPVFAITNGTFIFEDCYISEKPYRTTIENVQANIKLSMGDDFKDILYLDSEGSGVLNGRNGQAVEWVSGYDPTREKLTMSNTFHIRNLEFMHFEPYYDKFSPFIFKQGRAGGELVFNFDNGDIGSTNEIRLANLLLEAKEDHSFNKFWSTSAEDLYKYFSSSSGEVVFDFKIKGPMDNPKFYLGSKVKRALARMTFDKITDVLLKDKEAPGEGGPSTDTTPGQEKSDLEKIIDIFKGLEG